MFFEHTRILYEYYNCFGFYIDHIKDYESLNDFLEDEDMDLKRNVFDIEECKKRLKLNTKSICKPLDELSLTREPNNEITNNNYQEQTQIDITHNSIEDKNEIIKIDSRILLNDDSSSELFITYDKRKSNSKYSSSKEDNKKRSIIITKHQNKICIEEKNLFNNSNDEQISLNPTITTPILPSNQPTPTNQASNQTSDSTSSIIINSINNKNLNPSNPHEEDEQAPNNINESSCLEYDDYNNNSLDTNNLMDYNSYLDPFDINLDTFDVKDIIFTSNIVLERIYESFYFNNNLLALPFYLEQSNINPSLKSSSINEKETKHNTLPEEEIYLDTKAWLDGALSLKIEHMKNLQRYTEFGFTLAEFKSPLSRKERMESSYIEEFLEKMVEQEVLVLFSTKKGRKKYSFKKVN